MVTGMADEGFMRAAVVILATAPGGAAKVKQDPGCPHSCHDNGGSYARDLAWLWGNSLATRSPCWTG